MYNLVEALRIVALLVKSFLPETGGKIWAQLGLNGLQEQKLANAAWGGQLEPGVKTRKGEPIFPRIEKEEKQEAPAKIKQAKAAPVKREEPEGVLIEIGDFAKCRLVVAEILKAEPIKGGADRLLKLQVNLGGAEQRQIVAGGSHSIMLVMI